ncbi:glycosyltransferase [cf. Phormidesmis sp. LEGE 11477]|uniref:glycosyltransferase n=1 Tax=cf. Phormidesmis sp. LEGE 11477 TaxID=1828680 RepID=UPI0018811907|nr:glycosyltransferase [cf. Phormidesmis sp. LEGE 11477]MBE9060411.1 glycosyltransferase family 1 protein [cf. Phormidesmis sp. LEGE 11477]
MSKHILILTAGSRGDVQPYVALAKGLQREGFEVTIGTDSTFSTLIASHGVGFAPMRAPFAQMAQTDEGSAALAGKKSFDLKRIKIMLRQMMDDAWAIAQRIKPDMVIYHPKPLAGYHIADKLGIPGILAVALPLYSPTGEFFNPILGGGDRGHLLNWLSHTLFLKASLLPYRGFINRWRKEQLNLPPFSSELTMRGRPVPILYGYSSAVMPVPNDWKNSSHVTGYWFLDCDKAWEPPAELAAFLAEGEAPVYVGFGSMAARDARYTTNLILEAIQKVKTRAILAIGWGGLFDLELSEIPENVYMLESAPHDWLFPRCSAVVHHGGAGTTGAGLRAGKPTVVCPFFGDQPFWGKQIYKLEVGPQPIPQKHLSTDSLTQAIREAISSPRMRQNAESIGEKISAEDGVAQAIQIVKRHL